MQYAGNPGNLRDIARELGVNLLLEGSLQRTDGQIALNIQLIDGRTDEHVWAESYTRAYTLENVFAMQQELAREIAAQLSTTLTREETAELAAPPTASPEAWELYQQANKLYWSGPLTEDFQAAVDLYELAVKRDPAFALAHARLSFSLGQLWQSLIAFRTPEAEARMRQALARALELDPDLPEAFLAQGQIHYAIERDYGRALTALTRAARTGLKADYLHLLGAVQRRLGDFDGALANWEEMVRIDPLSAHYRADLGSTYKYAGRMDDAEPMLRRSIELDPTVAAVHTDLVDVMLARDGTTARAREALAAARAGTGDTLTLLEAYLDYLDRDWDTPLAEWITPQYQAWLLRRLGRAAEARAVAEEGERAWREAAPEQMDDPAFLVRGAWFAALLGDAESAAARVDAALALDPVARDALSGPDPFYNGAAALAAAGLADRALEVLEALSRLPSRYTPALIGLDPQFDELRGSAAYGRIMENWGRTSGG